MTQSSKSVNGHTNGYDHASPDVLMRRTHADRLRMYEIDAGIGIKGAVNFEGKKSYLGCFYPPEAVVITPAFLRTVPIPHLRAGCAEVIKMAIIKDRCLFERLEQWSHVLLKQRFQ